MISASAGLFGEARSILIEAGAKSSVDVVQLEDEQGHLFTLYEVDPSADWDWREGPDSLRPGVQVPDMANATACMVECRWEEMFARVVHRISANLSRATWVLDGDGVLWDASDVDPSEVCL
ncbi:hypothetical protein [Streptomyces sp. CC208A]|uniref:hypothetical protein n=1 Tax=Streptomyces sp. CC208A TaxID=3044573 RepID=UPI0024A954E8|nr:hypothetical protein [Streptomyces sp. CC208A]